MSWSSAWMPMPAFLEQSSDLNLFEEMFGSAELDEAGTPPASSDGP